MGVFKGMAKIMVGYEPFGYALYGKSGDQVLVVSSVCGAATKEGGYETRYVFTDSDSFLFVFGHMGECGNNVNKVEHIAGWRKLQMLFTLFNRSVSVFAEIDGRFVDKALLFMEWFSWVLGLEWMHNYYLERALSNIVKRYGIKKIGCIHEMHSYARVVWHVASNLGAKGYAIQHASISYGKRWYFPSREENASGLASPDFLYVFEKRLAEMLKPYFQHAKFMLGCSCRYSSWVSLKQILPAPKDGYYLFVGALAKFDNEVVLSSLRILLEEKGELPIVRVRLHPNAELARGAARWLERESEKGRIQLSIGVSLISDICSSKVVVGMSTTVLEESLLLGRPVVQLTHSDYLPFIDLEDMPGALRIDHKNISSEILKSFMSVADPARMRQRLGLDQCLVTFSQLFSEGQHQIAV
jgi:hypothetical protein